MDSAWRWKTTLATVATLLAFYFVLPNFFEAPEKNEGKEIELSWVQKLLPRSRVQLGLDLQGGIHMVLGIDLNRAMLNEADRYIRDLKEYLPKKDVELASVERAFDSTTITVKLKDPSKSKAFEDFVQNEFNVLSVESRDTSAGTFTLNITDQRRAEAEKMVIDQALGTLRDRLDEFGVAEPSIQAKGKDRIVVQLPGLADPERAKAVLGRTAQLEFKIVDDVSMDAVALENLVTEAKKTLPPKFKPEALNRTLSDKLPAGTQVLLSEDKDSTSGQVVQKAYLLKSEALLTGDMLDDAHIGVDQYNMPTVNLQFNPRGAQVFEKVTGDNVGKQLAIILDDQVQSAPQIKARIAGGRAEITFSGALKPRNETLQEAKDLALVLRAGALPAPVEILENRAVGPSLGRDSIESGAKAVLIGVLLVVAFMAFYYRVSGVLADLAVLFNVLFTIAALCALNATLTLPGIAGILISIGMAVDANVIIYERIREELSAGKSVKAAIEAGYDRAHLTIIDSNITTIITGVVLLQYGTGPIKGFAITLIFGLIANYFTALWFTRLAFDWAVVKFQPQKLSI